MRFLAIVRRKNEVFTEEQIAVYLEPEAERVRELYMQGVFRNVYSRGDVKGAVVELECASLEEANQVMQSMPFARQGMIDVEIIPLLPYRGFAPRGSGVLQPEAPAASNPAIAANAPGL